MAASPTQADVQQLRVAHRVRREFLVERNVIGENEHPSREMIRNAILRLTPAERKELKRRLTKERRRLTDLMDGDGKSFDEPRATQDDIIDGESWMWRNR